MTSGKISEAMVEAREDADYLCDAAGFPLGDIGAGDALAIIEGMPETPPEAFAAGWNAARRKAIAALSVPTPGTGGADKWLGELLAIIHRDGGQYQATHGVEKAVEDAHSILAAAFATPPAGDMGAVKVSEAELIKRLCESVEGECDGLAIDEDQARAILDHLGALSSTPVGEMDAATVEACAQIAETDQRSPMAKKSGHKPDWYKHGLSIAKRIRNLAPQGVR